MTVLSILLNFKIARDIKMSFCHTLHNKAFNHNPGCLTRPQKMFPGQLRWKVSESTTKTVEVDWSHLCEPKSIYGQSGVSVPISHSIIGHRRWQKWRDIIAFHNFDLTSRTPNNSSLDAPWDVQLSTRIKQVSRSAQREVRSFDAMPRRLLERKLHFVLVDMVGRRSSISRTRESQGWSLKTLHAATISLLLSLIPLLMLSPWLLLLLLHYHYHCVRY